jgi:hypothetical protein
MPLSGFEPAVPRNQGAVEPRINLSSSESHFIFSTRLQLTTLLHHYIIILLLHTAKCVNENDYNFDISFRLHSQFSHYPVCLPYLKYSRYSLLAKEQRTILLSVKAHTNTL